MKLRLIASPSTGIQDRVLVPAGDNPHARTLTITGENVTSRPEFLRSVLQALVDDTALQAGRYLVVRGEGIMDIVAASAGRIKDYQPVPKIPNRRENPFNINGFEGVRRFLGVGDVIPRHRKPMLEFWKPGSAQRYVATLHFGLDGEPLILVIPKKRILVAGHGTIGSETRSALQLLGIEIDVQAHSAGDNSISAKRAGAGIILSPDSKAADFDAAGIPHLATFEDAVQTHNYDVIVEAIEDTSKKDGPSPSQVLRDNVFRLAGATVPVIFQGGNPNDIAPRMFETMLMETLGIGPNFKEGAPSSLSVFIGSCNTHGYLHILAALVQWNKTHAGNDRIVDVEINDALARRRAGDTGTGTYDASGDGSPMQLNYHHREDVLAFFDQLGPEAQIPFAENSDGTPRFSTHATTELQQRFHYLHVPIRAKKADGTFLTAENLFSAFQALSRVAAVKFIGDTHDPAAIANVTHRQLKLHQVYLEIASVFQSGDGLIVEMAVPQESNVISDNIAAALILSGLVSQDAFGVAKANALANMVLGIQEIKRGIEEHSPLKPMKKKKK